MSTAAAWCRTIEAFDGLLYSSPTTATITGALDPAIGRVDSERATLLAVDGELERVHGDRDDEENRRDHRHTAARVHRPTSSVPIGKISGSWRISIDWIMRGVSNCRCSIRIDVDCVNCMVYRNLWFR